MLEPLRLFLLPNELVRFGGAERAGREAGAGEVWALPLKVGIAPTLLWSRRAINDPLPESAE